MYRKSLLFIFLITFITCFCNTNSAHLKGTFKSNEFFKFLVKFGFQKTDTHQKELSNGYIFGNITSRQKFSVPITFAVLDKSYFLQYYQNRGMHDKREACRRMFSRLKDKAFDYKCAQHGNDFLRRVPCPKNKLCVDEDVPLNVVKDYQFTYVIENLRQPS